MKKNNILFALLFLASCSGGGGGGMEVPLNSPPVITNSSSSYSVLENQNFAFTLQGSDPDGDTVSFNIFAGEDQNSFAINDSNQVIFLTNPDFENPTDSNNDNVFEVSIRAFDGSSYSSGYDFNITVLDDESDNGDGVVTPNCSEQTPDTSYCTLSWESRSREFYIVTPENFSIDQNLPLLISLHGGDDYADANMEYTGFKTIKDENNVVLMFPQGTVAEGKGSTGWYAGGDCTALEVCDLSFIEALIDFSVNDLGINPEMVYVSGFSNGAFMAYTLACFLSNKVAAFAPVAGSLSPEDYDSCNPQRPVPIIHIHGVNDSQIPVQGNDYVTPVQLVFNYWSSFNECSSTSVIDGDDNNGDGYGWYSDVSSGCQQGVSINYTYLENFDHYWPSSNADKGGGSDINGATFIWDFLSKYDINGLRN